jgi:ankyrin repeat protein
MREPMIDVFKEAVRNGDAAVVRAVLTAHRDLCAEMNRPQFETAPAIVFCRRNRDMVDVLLEFGADINARSQFWARTIGVLDDNTPEMRAYLIERGAVPEIGEFVEAVTTEDAAKVRSLLMDTPSLRQYIDRPLFHFGAQAIIVAKKNRPIVETLLEFGANINARSDWWAGGFGVLDGTDREQADWLIERGAIVDIHAAAALGMLDAVKAWLARDPSLVHARGGDGQLPLHFASTKEIIDVLLDYGGDINTRDIDHESTAAQYKVRDTDLCRYLISRGADVDIFMAAALGDPALAERAIDADPACLTARIGGRGYAPVPQGTIYRWKLEKGPSALRVAANYGGPQIYEFLYARSPAKEQFLDACLSADEPKATSLLAAHPDLVRNLPTDDRGHLTQAAFANNVPVVRLMLGLGFDVNARGGEGFTPVAHAALRGLVDVVRVLIDHGADLEIRNDYGGTALASCQWGSLNFRDPKGDYPACAEALLRAGAKLEDADFGSEAVLAVLRRHDGV